MKRSLQRKVVDLKAKESNGKANGHPAKGLKALKNSGDTMAGLIEEGGDIVDAVNGTEQGYHSRLRVRKAIRKLSYEDNDESGCYDDDGDMYFGKKRKGGKKKMRSNGHCPVLALNVESERQPFL